MTPMSLYAFAERSPTHRAALILGLSSAVIGGALFTEHVLGYIPCKLCLWQRWPYYFGVPLAAFALLVAGGLGMKQAARPAFAMLAAIFMMSVALGIHHSGVESGWWQGPADCGGKLQSGPASASDLMAAMQNTRIVSCTEATLKPLGLSLANWNAVLSFLIASLSIRGWRRPLPKI
jgi:disulfide bond formation protein DsbB